jgi:hypothetical protein
MAAKKAPTTPATRSRVAKAVAAPRSEPARATGIGSSNPSRLLREAAWSRMFGRVEAKNPFTR